MSPAHRGADPDPGSGRDPDPALDDAAWDPFNDPDDLDDGGPADGGAAGEGDERLGDGVEHLQTAAREMIAAARSFLDVVEDVVGDHAAVSSLAEALGSFSHLVTRAGARARDTAAGAASGGGPGGAADGDDGPRVQHIDVS